MIQGYTNLRNAYVNQRVQPMARVTIRKERLEFTMQRWQITDVAALGDDIHDAGSHKLLWADQAQDVVSNEILNLYPAKALPGNSGSYWTATVDDGDAQTVGGSVPSVDAKMRIGLQAKAGGGFRAFYVNASRELRYKDLVISSGAASFTGSESGAFVLPGYLAGTGLGVAPVGEMSCFVLGYSAPVLWLAYADWNDALGPIITLRVDNTMTWRTAAWLDAEPLPGSETRFIVTCPTGPYGAVQSVIYDTTTHTASPPFFILGTPGSDWLRRIWVTGLSTLNGRVWGAVLNDIGGNEGRYYAEHMALVSTTDGKFWRDEGFASCNPVRGKLFTTGTSVILASQTAYATSTADWRFGNTATYPTGPNRVVNNRRMLSLQAPSLDAPSQLTLGLNVDERTVIEPGARVEVELMAYGVAETLPLFSGRADQVVHSLAVDANEQQWLCRGNLARVIGDTAYKPLTTLEWKGRQEFYSDFQINGEAVMGLAVYADDGGYWIADHHPTTGKPCLKATATGVAVAPVRWPHERVMARMKLAMPRGGGFVFYIGNDATYETERWEAGIGTSPSPYLYIGRRQYSTILGVWYTAAVASTALPGYTANSEVELTLSLTEGSIRLAALSGYTESASLTYSGWNLEGGDAYDTPHPHAIGATVTVVNAADAVTQEAAYITEFHITDGGYPLTIQEALVGIFNICGVTATGAVDTYTGSEDPPLVSNVDALCSLTAAGQGLRLYAPAEDSTSYYQLKIYSTYTQLGWWDGSSETVVGRCYHHSSLSFAAELRVVVDETAICVYQNADLVSCIRHLAPAHRYYVQPIACTYQMVRCHQGLQTSQSQWIAWDANQPAATLIQNLLNQRRVYLMEHGNGVVQIRAGPETLDILIDALNQVNGLSSYRTIQRTASYSSDLRDYTGIVGVTDINGGRVYLIVPQVATYTMQSQIQESQRIATESDALHEAELLAQDTRRVLNRNEYQMFMDPAMELGDRFYDAATSTYHTVTGYTINLEMGDRLNHSATVQTVKSLTEWLSPSASMWDDSFYWDSTYWE